MGLSRERYLELQSRFLDLRNLRGRSRCEIIDYRSFEDGDKRPYHGPFMRVIQDASAGINELLNWTNHFALTVEDFATWATILEEIEDEDERFSTLFEIISPISFLALSFPAAIRSKLVFVCARIIRDSFNIKKDGKPLDDHMLNEKTLKFLIKEIPIRLLRERVEFFLQTLATLDGKGFREVTSNYRNRANHGIAPNIEIGQRMAFSALRGEGIEGFSFGVEYALKLNKLIKPLAEQHKTCTSSLRTFLPVLLAFREHWRMSKLPTIRPS